MSAPCTTAKRTFPACSRRWPPSAARTLVRATLVGGEKAGLDTYQAWIDDRGLADRIHLTGPLDGDGVVKAMQSHDVLVLNSRSEISRA